MNQALLVTYHYPPSQAVGAIRPSKFARYLPSYNWQPTVLTVRELSQRQMVHASAPMVLRVREWSHPLKSYEKWKERRAAQHGRREEYLAKITQSYDQILAAKRRGLGIKQWFSTFLWLPDREVGWILPSTLSALRLIRRQRMSHVITTGPPFSCHVMGLLLKRMMPIVWIADFRDPWSLKHKYAVFRNRATDAIETALIRSVMTRADRVISVTDAMTDEARKEWGQIDPAKFITLTSGFDASDFENLSWTRPRRDAMQPIVFSYFGTFYHGRTPEPFLRALSSLIQDGKLTQRDVMIRFVGKVERAEGTLVQELVTRYGLDGVVRLQPAIPRQDALRQMLESHVSLVLDERHPVQIPFKLYEALATGTLVFNIGARGAVADVLAKTNRGVVVDHTNQTEIRNGILECIRRSRELDPHGEAPWKAPDIQMFNFASLTKRLAEVLDMTQRGPKVAKAR